MIRNVACLLVGLAMMTSGCGGSSDAPKLAKVEGKVVWQAKPVADASVMFTPEKGPIAVGTTNKQGEFTLTTHSQPGASLGQHRVTIIAFEPVATPPAAAPSAKNPVPEGENIQKTVSRIPLKYSDLNQSGLTASVQKEASANKFNFELK